MTDYINATGPHSISPVRFPIANHNVIYKVWSSPYIDGIEIIESNVHLHNYPGHLHDSLEVIWIQSGSGVITCRSNMYECRAGEAIIIGANEIHSGTCMGNEPFSFIGIQLPRAFLEREVGSGKHLNDGMGTPVPIKVISKEAACEILSELLRELTYSDTGQRSNDRLNSLISNLFDLRTTVNCPTFSKAYKHPVVDQAKAVIREQCVTGVNIHDLADVVRLDVRYLITLFKSGTGLTPHQFQIAIRVELARKLLQQNIPLKEIAVMTGFSDQSHLNRHFKRQYGYSPGLYKHSVANQANFVQ